MTEIDERGAKLQGQELRIAELAQEVKDLKEREGAYNVKLKEAIAISQDQHNAHLELLEKFTACATAHKQLVQENAALRQRMGI